MRVIICLLFCAYHISAINFSKEIATRVDAVEFNKKVKGRHVLPSPKFFLHQLKNMCETLKHESIDFFLCHNLLPQQQYVLPILKYHNNEATEDVFMLQLMPEKIYYHNNKPVAVTSSEQDGQLRVLVPKTDVPNERLNQHLADILQTS